MRQTARISLLAFIVAAFALAQPKIGSIVNNASYVIPPVDSGNKPIGNDVIAQGSIFVVFGTDLGPATLTYPAGLPLPTSVPDPNGTSISVSSGGQKVDAYIDFDTSPLQVGAILPSNAPVGDATVTLTYNGKTSAAFKISVAQSRLGIFTSNGQGYGTAAAQHGVDSSPILMSKAAHPGETIVLYGTGLGPITTPDNVAPGNVQVGDVIVTIAGEVVKPDYAGRSPSFAGLDQIDFKIPADVVTGCYVPVSVTATNQVSQDFVVPIAKPGADACTHIFGLSASDLATLDTGGTLNIGLFQILRAFVTSLGGEVEGAGGLFDNANASAVFNIYNLIPVAYGAVSYPTPLNKCVVIDQVNTAGGFNLPAFNQIGGTELIPNSIVLGLSGPGGASGNILRQDDGGYVGVFITPILGPGAWTITGTGGPDVGPFTANITLPDNLKWTNAGNFSSVPQADLTIAWTGGTGSANAFVTVFGNSTIVNRADPSKTRAKSFYCSAPATAGKFVVPAAVRKQLPSASSGETAFGSLGISSGGFASFKAPLTKGTLNAGVIDYGEAHVLSVKY